MIESQIIRTLQEAVTAAVDERYDIKYLNINFEPPSDKKWWEIRYFPNNIQNEFYGREKTYRGILRLILNTPQDGKGIYSTMEEVELVAEHFKKGTKFETADGHIIQIVENPDVTAVIEESPYSIVPLTIRYQCFKM